MSEILLRPHHGLCIRFFEGKGYSDEFTAHMEKVIKELHKKDSRIILTEAEDEICKMCPNFLEGGCKDREKVRRYDQGVLDLTGLQTGEEMTFLKLKEQITARITAPDRMRDICGDCGWAEICREKAERK